ncbi:Papain inhibitor [Cytospora mali]|uniref:Papain inhibitor n=1 Tax=Cytospora mali TaxID=578113 RepID=A0A194V5X9_CYTMA|nr:Papain inhibitor [Valsa mali var. pyri (nom. inval.)]
MLSLQNLLTFSLALAPALAISIPRQDNGTSAMPNPDSTQTYTGQITYYNTGGGLGACGTTLSDSEAICALSESLYDQYTQNGNPNDNSLCGKQIQITMESGETATVTVADRCTGCAPTDIDLTPTIFQQLVPAGLGVGRTSATWKWAS